MRRSPRESGWRPVGALLASGVLGAVGAMLWARATIPRSHGISFIEMTGIGDVVAYGVTIAVGAGGALAGLFVAFVVIGWSKGRPRCPRCGTANDPSMSRCEACDLGLDHHG